MKNRKGPAANVGLDPAWARWAPLALALLAAVWVLAGLRAPRYDTAFPLADFGRLPVLNGGRTKPIDTVARTSLLLISGRQQTRRPDGGTQTALEWLLGVMFEPQRANQQKVFEIDDPDVLGLMNVQQTSERLYSFGQLQPFLGEIEKQAGLANEVKPETRSRYQSAVVNLQNKLELYQRLENTLQLSDAIHVADGMRYLEQDLIPALAAHWKKSDAKTKGALEELSRFVEQFRFLAQAAAFFPLPQSTAGQPAHWVSVGEAAADIARTGAMHPGVEAYAAMGDAYRDSSPEAFQKAVADFRTWLAYHAPEAADWAGYEFIFNSADPFFKSALLYLAAFVFVFVSWLAWPRAFGRGAFALLIAAFVVHSCGLAARIWIQGRPPVTNLYSSAVFVGWAAVLLGVVLERMTRRGIGAMVASAIGGLTLVVALHLDTQGDTMEMMRAVLDSNFWLATHVTCITIGYSSTFLSGFLGAFYILQQAAAPRRAEESAPAVEKMVYGVVCFSLFFSFVGTILGGIWADQSWGRFWGWDPKENGALMIVLWNAAVLHARWGRMVGRRGLMVMAVAGNIVTALSWFGVNMLGIGLHSYGFMDKAFAWLMAFIAVQASIIAAAFLRQPERDRA